MLWIRDRLKNSHTTMNPVRNALLIALSGMMPLNILLLPNFTPIARTQTTSPTPAVESPAPTPKPTTSPSPPAQKPTGTPKKTTAEEKEPAPTPEEIAHQQKLIEADRLYLAGQYAAAEKLYREVKPPFPQSPETFQRKEPITDLEKLAVPGQVYWRISTQGLQQHLETKIFVPLEMLVKQYPEFVPGQLRYVQALIDYNRQEEALQVLERATALYPNQPDLLRAKIALLKESKQWLEASLAARQFALLNPDDPAAEEFFKIADENMERYKSHLRAKLRGNAIANVITGVLGYAVTGGLFGPLTAIDSTVLLMRGESAVGEHVAKQAKRHLKLVEDKEVLDYVQEIGNKLVTVAGRNDFKYEFYVVRNDEINAFALPGGKVFINDGAILHTNSEAELAGLMAHELSHAVLSHGFQLATEGNLTANLTQYVPYGGLLGNLAALKYSREMERQADMLGTRLLSSTGYAADGLFNLMVTLNKQEHRHSGFSWLEDHPATPERVSYLQELIERNGYNRYAYEGVARHAKIKERVKKLIEESKKRDRQQNREHR